MMRGERGAGPTRAAEPSRRGGAKHEGPKACKVELDPATVTTSATRRRNARRWADPSWEVGRAASHPADATRRGRAPRQASTRRSTSPNKWDAASRASRPAWSSRDAASGSQRLVLQPAPPPSTASWTAECLPGSECRQIATTPSSTSRSAAFASGSVGPGPVRSKPWPRRPGRAGCTSYSKRRAARTRHRPCGRSLWSKDEHLRVRPQRGSRRMRASEGAAPCPCRRRPRPRRRRDGRHRPGCARPRQVAETNVVALAETSETGPKAAEGHAGGCTTLQPVTWTSRSPNCRWRREHPWPRGRYDAIELDGVMAWRGAGTVGRQACRWRKQRRGTGAARMRASGRPSPRG